MNRIVTMLTTLLVISFSWLQSAVAQDAAPKAVPVEFFACNFQDGKGMADLDKVIDKFKAYADQNDVGYTAWTLTPQFTNDREEDAFDVGWLGAWPDGNAFGKSQDNWMTKGRDVAKAFGAVIDCSNRHEMASSIAINAPEEPPGDGVVMFYACSLGDGKSPNDAIAAAGKLSGAMTALGTNASSWLFFPGMGAGDIDFDFWRVVAFNNYTELGAAAETYMNGGGWQKNMEILGPVAGCSSPGVYDARLVRAGARP